MASQTLQLQVCILGWRPETESHRPLLLFSVEHGVLTAYLRRSPTKAKAPPPLLDLFDDAEVLLTSSNQGHTWFLQESRVLKRREAIGRSYEALSHASAFTSIIARNPTVAEGRAELGALIGQALDSFATHEHAPEIVYFKALYSFARAEGHPVRQQWAEDLQEPLKAKALLLLHSPLASIPASDDLISAAKHLRRRLEDYLRGNTEMLIG
jgi:hypothetical protein